MAYFRRIAVLLLLASMTFAATLYSQPSKATSTADHSKFPELQRNFAKPEDVTKTCLSCHTEAGTEIMATSHWNWNRITKHMPGYEGEEIEIGKTNVVNNFCVGIQSNEPRCTSCHIGYGWKDKSFDFTNETKIDCLVCHEQTGTYKKFPTGAGYPVKERKMFKGNKKWYDVPDYAAIAQSVGQPTRNNCGTCHFKGGGGDGVKHGALDSALTKPKKHLDVHMGMDGANMVCVDCHIAPEHDIKGQLYSVSVENKDRVSCERCHTSKPHTSKLFVEQHEGRVKGKYLDLLLERPAPEDNAYHRRLDKHAEKVACQTCHIPNYGTGKPTKVWWDWSKAGKLDEKGKPIVKKDEDGHVLYHGKKGEFRYAHDAMPEYRWFTGEVSHIRFGDKIDPENAPIQVNEIFGVCGKPEAKIWPIKIMRGKQIYDPVNKTFIQPKLFGKKGTGAFWAEFDWAKSAEAGMKYAGLPYSGKFDFIETEMFWPLTHLVVPKEQSLKCEDCHTRKSYEEGGRLANLESCWLPGRDYNKFLDIIGILLVVGSLGGVFVHGTLRVMSSRKQ